MSNDYADRTHCNNGHEFTPENTTIRKDGGGRRCRACGNLRKQAGRKKSVNRTVQAISRERRYIAEARAKLSPEAFAVWEREYLAKKNPLEYLKLNPEQAATSDALNFALDKQKSKMACQKPVRIIHPTSGKEVDSFPFIDIDERVPYSAEQAEAMCADCPVLKQCNPYAKALRPPVGVLGGISWVDRKPVK